MRTIGTTFILLMIAAGAALAGVPRVINYQGRARTNNTPVTGKHQMTLSLYDSQTGGTPLFTEKQWITFTNDGIFSVAIGDSTSGGIPESIPFDQEYWLGVTISGINGGAELAPRLTIRSSPYSLRSINSDHADHADQADVATTAQGLELPAAITGNTGPDPMLDVDNSGDIGVQGKGSKYGVVSIGPDSTTHHYVSGEKLGSSSAPAPGGYYRDNAPIAWAVVDANGKLLSDFGVAQVIYTPTVGVYEVVLDNPVELTKNAYPAQFAPVITPGASSDVGSLVFPLWSYKPGAAPNPGSILVYMRDIQNRPTQSGFSIVVFGRPQ